MTEFVKDVVTTPDLPAYGLAAPSWQITLFSAVDDTNTVIAQLLFGTVQTNEVFVRRADEDSVYAVSLEDFNQLPEAGWELRERQIWNFSEADVAQITIRQNGKTRQLLHNGLNQWSLATGFTGHHRPGGHRGNGTSVWRARRRRLAGPQPGRPQKIRSETGEPFHHLRA